MSNKNYFFTKILGLILIIILLLIAFFNAKEELYWNLSNYESYKKITFYHIFTVHKRYNLDKLRLIFSKYKITCNKTVYLGYRIYSPYNHEFGIYSSSKIKLLSTIYLIDESSKISFDKKKEYIESLLIPLNKNAFLFETNLMKIRRLYFDGEI